MKDLDPFRSPDALIEHLCGYITDDSAIVIHVEREFGGTITVNNVRAARKRLAAQQFAKQPIEADNDDEFRRRKVKYAAHNDDFIKAMRRASNVA